TRNRHRVKLQARLSPWWTRGAGCACRLSAILVSRARGPPFTIQSLPRNLRSLSWASCLRAVCCGCWLTATLIAIDKCEHIRRDIDLVLDHDRLVDLTQHIVAAVRIDRLAVESQHETDVLPLAVVLHCVDDFQIRLVVNLRFAFHELFAKLA